MRREGSAAAWLSRAVVLLLLLGLAAASGNRARLQLEWVDDGQAVLPPKASGTHAGAVMFSRMLADVSSQSASTVAVGGLNKDQLAAAKVVINGTDMGYAGYFSVPAQHTSGRTNHIYTWYQPCTDCVEEQEPLLLWLQGGPGAPGTFGALTEVGNTYADMEGNVQQRCFSWCRTRSCLFVDQPVASGFSFQTDDSTGAVYTNLSSVDRTDTSIGAMRQVHQVLVQFYKAFPQVSRSPLVITGESYGGLYTAALGMVLLKEDTTGINFRGLAVGDPCINWVHQFPTYPSTLYGMGVIDIQERNRLQALLDSASQDLANGNCWQGFDKWNSLFNDNGGRADGGNFAKLTGSTNTANILMGGGAPEWQGYGMLMSNPAFLKAMHVPSFVASATLVDVSELNNDSPAHADHPGSLIYNAFIDSGDWCVNSSDWYAHIIANSDVDLMIYSAASDPILGPPTTEAGIMASLQTAAEASTQGREASARFLRAKKDVWRVDKDDSAVAGFGKCVVVNDMTGQRFCYSVVHNAGHELPAFQPRAALDMLNRFLDGRTFGPSGNDPSSLPTCAQCGGVAPFAGPSITPQQCPA